MNDDNEIVDVARVLDQVVEVGPNFREAELGTAVSRHVSDRQAVLSSPDPETVAALRRLAKTPAGDSNEDVAEISVTPLSVCVDFNDLLERLGEPEVWVVLGKLKDLLG